MPGGALLRGESSIMLPLYNRGGENMGYYIQTPMTIEKVDYLKNRHGAKEIECPGSLNEIPYEDKALVMVVDNVIFEAAGYIYDDNELKRALPTRKDQRKRTWLLMDKEWVENVTHFKKGKNTYE